MPNVPNHYNLKGTVVGVQAPIRLPSDNKNYLVFGFQAPSATRMINAVFYIRLDDASGAEWSSLAFQAFLEATAVVVNWTSDEVWEPTKKDPSGVISGLARE